MRRLLPLLALALPMLLSACDTQPTTAPERFINPYNALGVETARIALNAGNVSFGETQRKLAAALGMSPSSFEQMPVFHMSTTDDAPPVDTFFARVSGLLGQSPDLPIVMANAAAVERLSLAQSDSVRRKAGLFIAAFARAAATELALKRVRATVSEMTAMRLIQMGGPEDPPCYDEGCPDPEWTQGGFWGSAFGGGAGLSTGLTGYCALTGPAAPACGSGVFIGSFIGGFIGGMVYYTDTTRADWRTKSDGWCS